MSACLRVPACHAQKCALGFAFLRLDVSVTRAGTLSLPRSPPTKRLADSRSSINVCRVDGTRNKYEMSSPEARGEVIPPKSHSDEREVSSCPFCNSSWPHTGQLRKSQKTAAEEIIPTGCETFPEALPDRNLNAVNGMKTGELQSNTHSMTPCIGKKSDVYIYKYANTQKRSGRTHATVPSSHRVVD